MIPVWAAFILTFDPFFFSLIPPTFLYHLKLRQKPWKQRDQGSGSQQRLPSHSHRDHLLQALPRPCHRKIDEIRVFGGNLVGSIPVSLLLHIRLCRTGNALLHRHLISGIDFFTFYFLHLCMLQFCCLSYFQMPRYLGVNILKAVFWGIWFGGRVCVCLFEWAGAHWQQMQRQTSRRIQVYCDECLRRKANNQDQTFFVLLLRTNRDKVF